MSLLREIQTDVIDSKSDVASLLRKCKVLAARLSSAKFGAWLDNELSGYKSNDDLPDYRILRVPSKGNFLGPFGAQLRNAEIPMSCIPKKHQENISHSYLHIPVASIEALIEKSDEGSIQERWNRDFVLSVSEKIYENMNCMEAWKELPVSSLIAILDEIRNRVLNFVLEIEAENPDAGEAEINSSPVPQGTVNQIFNTHISGTVQNLTTGSHSFTQQATSTTVDTELLSQLIDALKSVKNSELRETLTSSVNEMNSTQGTEDFKIHYQKFMSLLADHIQVLGPIVAPYLPALAKIIG